MGCVNHEERAHARLSVSGSHKWLSCPPSALLEERFPDSGGTEFTREGTLAHELAELRLYTSGVAERGGGYSEEKETKIKADSQYSQEMEDYVEAYVRFVDELFTEAKAKTKDALLAVEAKLDLSAYIEDGFGTGDAVIIADGVLGVIDLKYGKGVRVSVVDNPQLKLYGLGALRAYDLAYDIHEVRLHIVQPRLDHIDSWAISADELRVWGETVVKPTAEMAFAGEGQQSAGEWCRWCKAAPRCKALAALAIEAAQKDFCDPSLLSDMELLDMHSKLDLITKWASTVSDYMLKEALKGKKWEGLKIVEGRSVRKWSDEEEVQATLANLSFDKDKYLITKLAGITVIEKLLGKKGFDLHLSALTVKPKGSPTLVHESDKRPEASYNSAIEDFTENDL